MTTDSWFAPRPLNRAPVEIDTTVAHPARVYDYWLGGKDNYAADREAARLAIAANPAIVPSVRANRAFLRRVVHDLTARAGIRQFLDIGTGIPSADNTHEVAQRTAPQARVVYVDNDPVVLAHASALLASTPEGATAYIHGDLRDPGPILRQAAETLDFSRPVAVTLLMILQFIRAEEDPYAIVSRLMGAVPPGSYLVISHPASDINPEVMAEMARRLSERQDADNQLTFRSHAQVCRFFDGLDLLEPGVVPLNRWLVHEAEPNPGHEIAGYCGIGLKRAG